MAGTLTDADAANALTGDPTYDDNIGVTTVEKAYGCVRDAPDARDRAYVPRQTIAGTPAAVPIKVDLRTKYSSITVYNQGLLSSCTAHAAAYAYHYTEKMQQLERKFHPSRMFIWHTTRALTGDQGKNEGCTLRNTMKALAATGVCTEGRWPYRLLKYDNKPPSACFAEAAQCRVTEYLSVTPATMKAAIASGHPVVFGFDVKSSFDGIGMFCHGKMPMPDAGEKTTGSHAVVAVGYDDAMEFEGGGRGGYICRNSWGKIWGDDGYFYMPYAYLAAGYTHSHWIIGGITQSNVGDPPTNWFQDNCVIS
jgi:C1A family cysteine protease